jgi:hypothetical protein
MLDKSAASSMFELAVGQYRRSAARKRGPPQLPARMS